MTYIDMLAYLDASDGTLFSCSHYSAESHPFSPHILATGCYDARVRLWDTRNMRSPVSLCGASVRTRGGVWKVKWHPSPSRQWLLLASCMRGGAYIADAGGNVCGRTTFEVACDQQLRFPFCSEALAYGVDWCQDRPRRCLLCSYYNRSVTMHGITVQT